MQKAKKRRDPLSAFCILPFAFLSRRYFPTLTRPCCITNASSRGSPGRSDATVSDDSCKSLRPERVAEAGATIRHSVHAPAGKGHDDSSTPLSEARIVAPLACAARNGRMNRSSAGASICHRTVDVRCDHRKCCVPASSAKCQPVLKNESLAGPISRAPVAGSEGTGCRQTRTA